MMCVLLIVFDECMLREHVQIIKLCCDISCSFSWLLLYPRIIANNIIGVNVYMMHCHHHCKCGQS